MSSKGRGSEVEPSEFYETPRWCVYRLLDRIHYLIFPPGKRPRQSMIEPAVGNGAIVRAITDWLADKRPRMPAPVWHCWDIRPESRSVAGEFAAMVKVGSFMAAVESDQSIKAIGARTAITNPPFSKALDMVRSAMQVAPVVISLGRIGWLGSDERADWMRNNTPSVYLLPERPSFTNEGRTDSDYYAWFVWGLGDPRFEILDSTPLQERRSEYATGKIQ